MYAIVKILVRPFGIREQRQTVKCLCWNNCSLSPSLFLSEICCVKSHVNSDVVCAKANQRMRSWKSLNTMHSNHQHIILSFRRSNKQTFTCLSAHEFNAECKMLAVATTMKHSLFSDSEPSAKILRRRCLRFHFQLSSLEFLDLVCHHYIRHISRFHVAVLRFFVRMTL